VTLLPSADTHSTHQLHHASAQRTVKLAAQTVSPTALINCTMHQHSGLLSSRLKQWHSQHSSTAPCISTADC